MLEQKDIEQAKYLFKEWDISNIWDNPNTAYIEHCKKKAEESLFLAKYLLNKIEKTKELENNGTTTIWIVTLSYYSMFFEVEYLLSIDKRKLPTGTENTHKTIYLAFLYYYVIKGSELERNKPKKITTSRMSRALSLFKEVQDESLELQRIEKSVRDLKKQREQRHSFTYQMSRSAEISEAKNSIFKASEFRELIEEYILSRRVK
ncbi:MAG: hypothetical protein HY831_01930 [Candidatus Aenigmarchaeota archaeon]|nr:hypothetical protein [Candidatus Aenigmarchaeota archaeon]